MLISWLVPGFHNAIFYLSINHHIVHSICLWIKFRLHFRSGYIDETLQFTKENSIVLWCRLCSSSTHMCFRRPLEMEVGIPPELTILYLLFYVYIVILQGYGCCINLNLFFQLLSILNCFEANSKGISFTVVDYIMYRLHYYVFDCKYKSYGYMNRLHYHTFVVVTKHHHLQPIPVSTHSHSKN